MALLRVSGAAQRSILFLLGLGFVGLGILGCGVSSPEPAETQQGPTNQSVMHGSAPAEREAGGAALETTGSEGPSVGGETTGNAADDPGSHDLESHDLESHDLESHDLESHSPVSHPLQAKTGQASAESPNILLIAVDTLRADRLGLYGHDRPTSPHLDRLARDGLVFERAIAPAPWTTPSFAGIFTGHHPGELGIGFKPLPLPKETPTLTEALSSRGYATAGVVSHLFIGEKFGFHRGFDFWDQSESGGHDTISSEGVADLALSYLETFEQSGRPFFLLAHFFDPHYDYAGHRDYPFHKQYKGKLRSTRDNFEQLRRIAKAGKLKPEDQQYLLDLYDSEIAFTDSQIGRILDALREKDLYDETLIVFLSDHGEMFGQRNDRWIGHTQFLFDELIRVPLMLKLPKTGAPGLRVGRVNATVSLIDLMPTVLGLVEPTDPGGDPSRSLLPDREGQLSSRVTFSQTRRWRKLDAMYDDHWKLIVDRRNGRSLLYDLSRDPGERSNVANDHPDRLVEMKSDLDLWNKAIQLSASKWVGQAEPELSDEEIEKIRSLGYIR